MSLSVWDSDSSSPRSPAIADSGIPRRSDGWSCTAQLILFGPSGLIFCQPLRDQGLAQRGTTAGRVKVPRHYGN